jgi:hypothetical protein
MPLFSVISLEREMENEGREDQSCITEKISRASKLGLGCMYMFTSAWKQRQRSLAGPSMRMALSLSHAASYAVEYTVHA